MRWTILISLVLIAAGACLLVYIKQVPIYTDSHAPDRLSNELYPSPGDMKAEALDKRYHEWTLRLRAYETPHKGLSDLGRGLCSAGLGFLLASGFWYSYHHYEWIRTTRALLILWISLWAARIPLSIWYYGVREFRRDYPSWDDSITIPIFGECITWIVGATISSLVLALLLRGREFQAEIRWGYPRSTQAWFRTIFLAGWIALLGILLLFGIPDGDEGVILTSIIAIVILIAVSSAAVRDRNQATSFAHKFPRISNA